MAMMCGITVKESFDKSKRRDWNCRNSKVGEGYFLKGHFPDHTRSHCLGCGLESG